MSESSVDFASTFASHTSHDISDHSVLLYSGWLQKQGGVFAGWKTRYFQLFSGGKLEYKRKDGGGGPAGYIALKGATLNITFNTDPNGIMELSSPLQSRVFYLKGEQSEFNRWRVILNREIKALKGGPKFRDSDTVSIKSRPNSELLITDSPQRVYKCGWLEKRGKLNKAFKKRWFVLKNQTLEYYKTPNAVASSVDPQGIILVAEGLSSIIDGETPYAKFLQLYSVEGRIYTLTSHSQIELQNWLAAIQDRHAESRVSGFTAVSHAQPPAAEAIANPPPSTASSIKGTMSTKKKLIRPILKAASHTYVCKLGCGGAACKKCDPCRGLDTPIVSAIDGLNASWVTHNIIASTRPSERLIRTHNIISQFRSSGITAVFNLQQAGEHADCGDGVIDGKWSYKPQTFYEAGISVYIFSFPDYGVPTVESALTMTKAIAQEISYGSKCLVHCHAGHGRTGILISCYLVYALGYTASQAVTLTRQRRDKAIQTKGQVNLVKGFETMLNSKRRIFNALGGNNSSPSRMRTLDKHMIDQNLILTEAEVQAYPNLPKLVWVVQRTIIDRLREDSKRKCEAKSTSEEKLARLKSFVDVGVWEPIRKCQDIYVLLALLVDFLNLFSSQPLSPNAIMNIIARSTNSQSPNRVPIQISEDPVELELVNSILGILQTLHRFDLKSNMRRLSNQLAHVLSCIDLPTNIEGAKRLPLADGLETLALLDLPYNGTMKTVAFVDDLEERPVSLVSMETDIIEIENDVEVFQEADLERPSVARSEDAVTPLMPAESESDLLASELQEIASMTDLPPIPQASKPVVYDIASAGPATSHKAKVIYTSVDRLLRSSETIIGGLKPEDRITYTTVANIESTQMLVPSAEDWDSESTASVASDDETPTPSSDEADDFDDLGRDPKMEESDGFEAEAVRVDEIESMVPERLPTMDPHSGVDTCSSNPSDTNTSTDDNGANDIRPAVVGTGERARLLTGLDANNLRRIRHIRASVSSLSSTKE